MSSEHTPGPWRVVNRHYYFAIYTGPIGQNPVGCQIADTNHENAGNQEANARRIVACVNACEGLSTETLEAAGLGKGVLDHLKAERDLFRSRVAELVEALEIICGTERGEKEMREVARLMLAKAKP